MQDEYKREIIFSEYVQVQFPYYGSLLSRTNAAAVAPIIMHGSADAAGVAVFVGHGVGTLTVVALRGVCVVAAVGILVVEAVATASRSALTLAVESVLTVTHLI